MRSGLAESSITMEAGSREPACLNSHCARPCSPAYPSGPMDSVQLRIPPRPLDHKPMLGAPSSSAAIPNNSSPEPTATK